MVLRVSQQAPAPPAPPPTPLRLGTHLEHVRGLKAHGDLASDDHDREVVACDEDPLLVPLVERLRLAAVGQPQLGDDAADKKQGNSDDH